jgi:hypothetical protein
MTAERIAVADPEAALMWTYILRRLLLIIPTLVIILLVNFVIVQAAPGGPVEQAIAHCKASAGECRRRQRSRERQLPRQPWPRPATDQGHRKTVRLRQAGPERLWLMLTSYARLDFGKSFFRGAITDLILEKMPVTISLGLWATLITYLVSIPLGIQGRAPRQPFRYLEQHRDHHRLRCRRSCSRCSDRGVRRRSLNWFPVRGWSRTTNHCRPWARSPTTSGTWCCR